MKYFIVAMPGCGNYGDDLISYHLVEQILNKDKDAMIIVMCGDEKMMIHDSDNIIYVKAPRRNSFQNYFGRKSVIKKHLSSSDYLLIGGGGLLQDVHSKYNIHSYFKYLKHVPPKCVNALVGIGYGPILFDSTIKYLRKYLKYFDQIIVRDVKSQESLQNFTQQKIELQPDIVEGANTTFENLNKENFLGISIRPWKGITVEKICFLIKSLCDKYQFDGVKAFVFEHTELHTSEYDYAAQIAQHLSKQEISTEIYCYNKNDYNEFFGHLNTVKNAIATRFHANILWQQLGTSCIPLAYAPKVLALYEDRNISIENIDEVLTGKHLDFKSISFSYKFSIDLPQEEKKTKLLAFSDRINLIAIDAVQTIGSLFNSILIRIK